MSFDRAVTQASKLPAFAETEFSGELEGDLCLCNSPILPYTSTSDLSEHNRPAMEM